MSEIREIPKWQRDKYNPRTGRFMKGHPSHNKGKKWSEYMSPEGQERAKKGWANLGTKGMKRPDNAGRRNRPCVGFDEEGRPHFYKNLKTAGDARCVAWANIRAVCLGKRKHCGGWRWLFAEDDAVAVEMKKYYGE